MLLANFVCVAHIVSLLDRAVLERKLPEGKLHGCPLLCTKYQWPILWKTSEPFGGSGDDCFPLCKTWVPVQLCLKTPVLLRDTVCSQGEFRRGRFLSYKAPSASSSENANPSSGKTRPPPNHVVAETGLWCRSRALPGSLTLKEAAVTGWFVSLTLEGVICFSPAQWYTCEIPVTWEAETRWLQVLGQPD